MIKTPRQYEIWINGFSRLAHDPFPTRKAANDFIKFNIDDRNKHKYKVREML
jgi:hypothetical protein